MTKQNKKTSKGDSKFIACEHLDKVGEIATYFGFMPYKSPEITKSDLSIAKEILEGDFVDDETEKHNKLPLHVEEKIAILRMYHEQGLFSLAQPVMMYFKDSCKGSDRRGSYSRYADMEIVGTSGSIAEATLIQTAISMLAEEGHTNVSVEINSIGDKESISRFTREITNYYRKKINDMSAPMRQIFKKDPFELLACHTEECAKINEGAPKTMDFLSENSRKHLEEVLEYLESLGVPYTINNSLIGNRKYCSETIFAVVDADTKSKQKILAIGERYTGLGKRLGMKKDVHGVGISLLIKNKKAGLRDTVKKIKRPVASFMQLGIESKLLSLQIIESLRKVKVPLYFSLAKDRLGAQVSNIEKFHTPYMLVMGKKEAVDRTVVVRKVDIHSQDIVPIQDLPAHMKKIEEKYYKETK